MTQPKPLTDAELGTLIDQEVRQAIGFYGGKLAEQRRNAEAYFLGEAKGDLAPPEIEGRSAVVVPVVRNTIESMLPQLMVKFTGGDTVVEFEPTQPDDEPKAKNCTEYLNYLFFKKNNGHAITYGWFKDALKLKRGIIKVWWDNRDEETREEYEGLTQIELAQVMDDGEVEVTEQKSYPDEEEAKSRKQQLEQLQQQLDQAMQAAQQDGQAAQQVEQLQQQMQQLSKAPPALLYDIVCKRTRAGGKVTIENVPPEEFLISRKAKDIQNAPFVGHRVARTLSELRSMGYKNLDDIGSDDAQSQNAERIERMSYDDEYADMTDSTGDASQKRIWVIEGYMRCDYDGDGIAELRKVVRAGGQTLENEIVDIIPFVSVCPIPEPHKFFGLSISDVTMTGQKTETALLRSVIDNAQLEVNGRYFAVENQVNLDDLLSSRPGGVVRVKSAGAVGRLDQGKGSMAETMSLLEYMKGYNEDSSGWSRQSQGNDPSSLSKPETATKANIVTNRADMRTDLIARNFAEGFVELFRLMLKLVTQHQKKKLQIRLSGTWVDMDPREWRNQFDVSINVGLGVGNKDQQVGHLTNLMQLQMNGMQIGIVNPENIYNAGVELAKNMGFKNGDKYFSKPDPNNPPPDPMAGEMQKHQMELQAKGQMHQAEMQSKAQIEQMKMQQEAQLEQMRAQMQTEVDNNRQRSEAEQQTQKIQQEMQLKLLEAQQAQERFAAEQAQAVEIEKIKAQAQIIVARIGAGAMESGAEQDGEARIFTEPTSQGDVIRMQLAEVVDKFGQALEAMNQNAARPRQIVRDQNGRAVGIQ